MTIGDRTPETILQTLEAQLSAIGSESLANCTLRSTKEGYRVDKLNWFDRFVRFFMPSKYDSSESIIQIVQLMKFSFHSGGDTVSYYKLSSHLKRFLPPSSAKTSLQAVANRKIREITLSLKKLENPAFVHTLTQLCALPEKIAKTQERDEFITVFFQELAKVQLPDKRLRGHEHLQKVRDEIVTHVQKRLFDSKGSVSLRDAEEIIKKINEFDRSFGTKPSGSSIDITTIVPKLQKLKENALLKSAKEFIKDPLNKAQDFQQVVTRFRREVGEDQYAQFHTTSDLQHLVSRVNNTLLRGLVSDTFTQPARLSVQSLQKLTEGEQVAIPKKVDFGMNGANAYQLVVDWANYIPNLYSAVKTFQRKEIETIQVNGKLLGTIMVRDSDMTDEAYGNYKVAKLCEALLEQAQATLPQAPAEKLKQLIAEAVCVACGDLNPLGQCSFLAIGVKELQPPDSSKGVIFSHQESGAQPADRVQFNFSENGMCEVVLKMNFVRNSETKLQPMQITSTVNKSLHKLTGDWEGKLQAKHLEDVWG